MSASGSHGRASEGPIATYIFGVQALPYLKKDVPKNNQDFQATRQKSATTFCCQPEHIVIVPVLIAPECPMAIMYSLWLKTLPPVIAVDTLPMIIMNPTPYAKHLGFKGDEAAALVAFAEEFTKYGHPIQMSLVTADRTDIRPVTVPPVHPPGIAQSSQHQA